MGQAPGHQARDQAQAKLVLGQTLWKAVLWYWIRTGSQASPTTTSGSVCSAQCHPTVLFARNDATLGLPRLCILESRSLWRF